MAYLRAILCRDGLEAMRRDAQDRAGMDSARPARIAPTMIHAEGLSHLLEGDADRADAIFARAVDAAIRARAPFVALLLADRGIAAIERADWAAAGTFADQALTIMHGGEFDDYWTSALVYAWAARVALQRGDPEQGDSSSHEPLGSGHCSPTRFPSSRPRRCSRWRGPTSRSPIRAALGPSSGRPTTSSSSGPPSASCRSTPTSFGPRSTRFVPTAWGRRRSRPPSSGSSRCCPTHLSFREIGERLYVSRHTVKTQAISIYRKLGVSSRSETIERMHRGLLEHV